jgi:hypothetical protein
MKERIAYIKDFAEKMEYEVKEYKYNHCDNGRPCLGIELIGTYDSEGEPFAWAWYLDTGEEF